MRLPVAFVLVFALAASGCFTAHDRAARSGSPPPGSTTAVAPVPPPPPGPPAPPPSPALPVVQEISVLLEQTHPEVILSLSGLGERAAAAARAPARDPARAEKIGRALEGGAVLAELTNRLASDPAVAGLPALREWLAGADGQAFIAARKHAVEVRKGRSNLAGPALDRRNACRRLLIALGDGRFSGRLDHAIVTQTFLGSSRAAKKTGDIHKNLIAQGPWLLERAADLGTSTAQWHVASIDAASSFWEAAPAKAWVDAIDTHLGAIVETRLSEAEHSAPAP